MAASCRINAAQSTAFMQLLPLRSAPHSCGMPQSAPELAAQVRDWMNDILNLKGWSAAELAKRAQVAPSTVQRALKADYEFVTSSRTLQKLAQAAGVEPMKLEGTTPASEQAFLPIRYRVQAGHWLKHDDAVQDFGETYPVSPNPRFAGHPQWLEEVVGDSADRVIPDGSFIHVVDAISIGYEPRNGNWVVVQRTRHGGMTYERSVKQVAIKGRRVELWPRSNNPKWDEPLNLMGSAVDGEEIEVAVVGLVIGFYNPMLI